MHQAEFKDFEEFWPHFLSSHQNSLTRWMHVAGLAAGTGGIATALILKKKWPLLLGTGLFAALALGAIDQDLAHLAQSKANSEV